MKITSAEPFNISNIYDYVKNSVMIVEEYISSFKFVCCRFFMFIPYIINN